MQNKYLRMIVSLAIPQLAGALGSLFTSPKIPTWYDSIIKPDLVPPSWVFGVVWPTLFTLMGIGLYIVWTKALKVKGTKPKTALIIFGFQLAVNSIWSIAFFGWENPFLALVIVIILWLLILANIISFYRVSKPAGLVLIPYILWVSFATYLNYSIWVLNK